MADATHDPLRARQTALAATPARRMPLGRAGLGLRRATREAGPSATPSLLAAVADALRELHDAGWGTEDPVAAALVTPEGRVRFLPDLVWPLGTLVAARPVAAWLDLADVGRWLDEAGLAAAAPPALTHPPAPWPGWPRLEPGPVAVLGPVAEIAALARYARLPWAPAASLRRREGVAWALEAIARDAPWLIPLADAEWLATLPTVPRRILRLACAGAAPDLPPETIEALGIRAEALIRPSGPAAQGPAAAEEATARRLELAALLDDDARAGAEAEALLVATEAAVDRARPPADLDARFTAIIDLARAAGDRTIGYRATLGRGLVRGASLDSERARAGRADLVEARRLAGALDRPDDVVLADAALVLLTALDDEPRAAPDPRPATDALALLWRRAAEAAAALPRDEGASALEAAPALLAAACVAGSPTLAGAVVELLGGAAIAAGRERHAERLVAAARAAAPPPGCAALLLAWSALLAARRGAPLLARDRLIELDAALDAAPATGWAHRAASWGAVAARALGSDGLAARFAADAPDRAPARLTRAPGDDGLDRLGNAPAGLATLIAEAALAGPEAVRRAARGALAARLARLEPERWPAGLALALGRLAASTYYPDEARRALEIATGRGERHVERAALDALHAVLLQSNPSPEALAAVARRRDQLAALRPPPADPDAPAPLSPAAAARDESALVRRAAAAAARHPGELRWEAAVEELCGPLVAPTLPAASAADGLALDVDGDGRWILAAIDGATAHLERAPLAPPAAIARTLTALAPLLVADGAHVPAGREQPERVWATATDLALCEGTARFDDAVIAPFRAHDLTRDHLRALLDLGLTATSGLYRALAHRWGIADGDYQRFMDFLRRSNAALDYRSYRRLS